MTFSLSPVFRGWRAALLLVAVACASPDRASAECGDHVVILNAAPQVNPDGRAATGVAERPASPKAPCSGPNCSRAPERHAPPFAPVSTSAPQGKEVVQVLDSVEPADGATTRVRDFISPRPVRRAASVFHPPRA
jgi:hypothetical protein